VIKICAIIALVHGLNKAPFASPTPLALQAGCSVHFITVALISTCHIIDGSLFIVLHKSALLIASRHTLI